MVAKIDFVIPTRERSETGGICFYQLSRVQFGLVSGEKIPQRLKPVEWRR
jgi:hypothetical protein